MDLFISAMVPENDAILALRAKAADRQGEALQQ